MIFLLLHVIDCLMVNVECVDVIGIESPKVPNLHVLQRLSPHLENPVGVEFLLLWCILVKCMVFPLPEEKVRPHSSQVQLVLSMLTCDVVLYITVSGESRRLTSKSFRFLFLL